MAKASMKERVAALIAKAKDPAATEAEAEACMNMAMGLMSKFGLSMDDVTGDEAEPIGMSKTRFCKGRAGGAMIYVTPAIAAFTSTRVAFAGNGTRGTKTMYYGYGPERDLAIWLHGHIEEAIARESRAYDPGPYSTSIRTRDRKSFAVYMAKRIAQRLRDLTEDLDDAGRGTGRDVMVVKNRLLDEHYEGLGIGSYQHRPSKLYREGAEAGAAAGQKVSLHRPVSDDTGPLRLGSA